MSTMAEASKARDELLGEVGFLQGPQKTGVIGIGVAREREGYYIAVDVTSPHVNLPTEVQGVPVRAIVSSMPRAYGTAPVAKGHSTSESNRDRLRLVRKKKERATSKKRKVVFRVKRRDQD